MHSALFVLLSGIAIGAALLVIFQKDVVFSALYLTLTLLCVSGLFYLLSAPFVAALQILVYAGAIMVLFTFVIMMVAEENVSERDALPYQKPLVILLAALAALQGRAALKLVQLKLSWSEELNFTLHEFGKKLYGETTFAFEVTSLILLAAIVGVLALSRRERKQQ